MSKNHNFKDLTNQKFGYLTPLYIDEARTTSNKTYWFCVCVCGKTRSLQTHQLTSGKVTSCGCHNPRFLLHEEIVKRKRLYNIYSGMIARCYHSQSISYKYYGGKGITVCDEWKDSFKAFALWAESNGYNDNLSIDRINNTKGYSPDNCRWIPKNRQQNNRSTSVYYTHNGETHTMIDWCKILHFDYTLAKSRRKEAKRKNIEDTFEYVFAPKRVHKSK